MDYPNNLEMRVSHETIYQSLFVQGRGELKRELSRYLRTGRTRHKSQGRQHRRERIPDMVMTNHANITMATGMPIYFCDPLPVATRLQREHQRVASPIPAKGDRPLRPHGG